MSSGWLRLTEVGSQSGLIRQISLSVRGGVPKRPVRQAETGPLGIAGDGHRFRQHGGPDKALLLLASEVVDTLRDEGWPVYYGALGENLTTAGLDYSAWQSGQRFLCGDVLIELTTAREPCATLNRYGRGIQTRLKQKPGESGFYAAVLKGGIIIPGSIIELVERIS